VHLVSPHGKAGVPNDDDYNFDPKADEFYQPEGLEGSLEIDISSLMDMEENNDIDEDEGDDVQDAEDLRILEKWQRERDGVVQDDEELRILENRQTDDEDDAELDNIDSDDEDSGDETAPTILPFVEIISRPRNAIFLLLLSCNYVFLLLVVINLC